MLKLKIDDCEIKDGAVILKKMTIFDDSSSRDVDVNEKGQSLVLKVKTGEKIIVDNMELMYTNLYKESEYKILGEYYPNEG